MAKSRGARTPSYAKTNVLSGSIGPRPYQKKKTDTVFITPARLPRKTFDR